MRLSSVTADHRLYVPYGAAALLWTDRSAEILLSGPAGTGKSRGCLEKILAVAEHWPGSRILVCRKTRRSLTETGLVTFEEKVIPAGHPLLAGPRRPFRSSYLHPNKSEIIVGGLDDLTKIMSGEYDMIFVQEAIEASEDDIEKLTTRLRNGVMPFQQLIMDTNPAEPIHWLKLRCDRGATVFYDSRHEDNPTLFDPKTGEMTEQGRSYIATLDRLTGPRKDRLRFGRWVQAEGVVYDGWNTAIHLIDRFEIPAAWPRFWSIDFGYTNPFVWQAWAVDPDGRLYLYREIYMTQVLVEDHALVIQAVTKNDPRPRMIVCDHDAEDRATLARKLGMVNFPAYKAINAGIQGVTNRLRIAGDGKARLFILRDSLVRRDTQLPDGKPWCTAQEFDSYIWPKGIDGKPLKEEPVDDNNHGMDALRYQVASTDKLGVQQIRVLSKGK